MRILYVFPHPDDESFGFGPSIAQQRRQGHEVFLLTLTRGGATKARFERGLSIEEMGELRLAEMQAVSETLQLSSLRVLDLPDSALKHLDPRQIEAPIRDWVEELQPEVLVTYAVHGISGFHDHLVCHASVKRVFVECRERGITRRLALCTLSESSVARAAEAGAGIHRLQCSKPEEISCVIVPDANDIARGLAALDCYKSYLQTIEKSGVREVIKLPASFELFQEHFDPPLDDICASVPN